MTTPASSQVCAPWATLADLPSTRPTLTDGQWNELLLVATEILWALSGRRWSGEGCGATATLRAQSGSCSWWSTTAAGQFYPVTTAAHVGAVKLPHDEVTEVVSVTVGATPFLWWRLQGSWLYRTDGRQWWASDADVSISYLWGLAPPAGGRRAAAAYALELGRALADSAECRLPERVVSVTRQGVSMTLIDPQRYLDQGRLGIPDIDQWLAAVNPAGLAERASVWSPDVPRASLG